MQYVGRAIGSVSKTWNSINPATLSGAIDIMVVEQPDGTLSCSPFHVRFGKFSLLRPSQKKVQFSVNGEATDLPMKLGDGGEAFFVFETPNKVPSDLLTSPVVSPSSSPESIVADDEDVEGRPLQEPEFLDLSRTEPERARSESPQRPPNKDGSLRSADSFPPPPANNAQWSESSPSLTEAPPLSPGEPEPERAISKDRVHSLTKRLTDINIPSKITDNGDIVLDMTGYKSGADEFRTSEAVVKKLLAEELGLGPELDFESIMGPDEEGNIRIYSRDDLYAATAGHRHSHSHHPFPSAEDTAPVTPAPESSSSSSEPASTEGTPTAGEPFYAKTLRLTSDQLKKLNLKSGRNEVQFKVLQNKAVINAHLYYWKSNAPIVISDIDGTITKSDALGHVLTMLGRDWTHSGVAKLYVDIANNGYNIVYLTARSVGQADATRYYLQGIEQEGYRMPPGPVILSPDRTMAALRREVIMRKPEVFKMAALRDIQSLYDYKEGTPFYAGFGNRITDALSYRSVGIPSSKIFTINTNSEVHMELLELAGYRSSYVHIADLVDHFFPPVVASGGKDVENKYSDVNFWRDPIPDISDLESLDEFEDEGPKSPKSPEQRAKSPSDMLSSSQSPQKANEKTSDKSGPMDMGPPVMSSEKKSDKGEEDEDDEDYDEDYEDDNYEDEYDDYEYDEDEYDDYDYENEDYQDGETPDERQGRSRQRRSIVYTHFGAREPAHLEQARTLRETLKDINTNL